MSESDRSNHKHHHHHHKHHKKGRTKRQIIMIVAVIVLLFAAAIVTGQILDRNSGGREERSTITSGQSVRMQVDGVTYRKRRSLTSLLLMGIDDGSEGHSAGFRNGGQSDFLRVIVIDDSAKKIYQLPIDRDTMVTITTLGMFGNKAGTRLAQICLQHAYGQTEEQRNSLTMSVVQNLLDGQQIDHYISLNVKGVSVVNDWAGGVTVTLDEDLTEKDPSWVAGATITLQGDAAETYVRSRQGISDGLNTSRMKRQQSYIRSLTEALNKRFESGKSNVGELFDLTKPYMTTDMSRARLINLVWNAKDYETVTLSIDGSRVIGAHNYMEFTPDQSSIEQALLTMFYEPVADS